MVASGVGGKPPDMLALANGCTPPEPLDKPLEPERGLIVAGLRFAVPPSPGPISEAALIDQIVNGKRAVEIFWSLGGSWGSGHVALVTGYDAMTRTFCLLDPLVGGAGWVTYMYLWTYGGHGRWNQTYYSIGA